MTVDVHDCKQRHESLMQERQPWEADWQKLAVHFSPTKCRLEREGDQTNKGFMRSGTLDSTGHYALRDLSAGLHSSLTSPARPWFRLARKGLGLEQHGDVKEWLDQVTELMRRVLHKSNFYKAVHALYNEVGGFGTGFMFCLPDEKNLVHFTTLTIGEYCLDTNEKGRVDTVFRTIHMTLRQIVQEFGLSPLPQWMQDAYQEKRNWTMRYKVVHAVFPREGGTRSTANAKKMPFASVYYLDGTAGSTKNSLAKTPALLRESGFQFFPGFGVRWDVTGNDVYGKAPTHDTLPDSVLLQQMTVTMLKAVHKLVDPPMVAPAEMEGNLSLLPGAANFTSSHAGAASQVYPAMQVRPDVGATYQTIEKLADKVRKGLFNDLFRMLLNSDRRQITAREVMAREEEKLLLIGPTLERLQDELFTPLIDLVFSFLAEANALPPVPESLHGAVLDVDFISVLAQAQKMVATGSVEQFMGFVGQMAQIFPEALDTVVCDEVISAYGDYIGVESKIIRGDDERDAMRQERQQQQAQAQQMQEGMAMAQMAAQLGMDPASTGQPGAEDLEALQALQG